MHKAYSLDLRERAVAAVEAGLLQAQVVRLFGVSLATLKRWLLKRRKGLSLASKAYRRGFPAHFSRPEALAALGAQLQADPDGRLVDHCQRWPQRTGQWLSVATLHRARRALGWRQKKKAGRCRARRSRTGGLAPSPQGLKPTGLGLCR